MKFLKSKKITPKVDFFELPAKEKVKIIRKSAREANDLQLNLIKKYNLAYSK